MKKSLWLSSIAFTLFVLYSCSKAAEVVFHAVEVPLPVEFTIPVITNTSTESSLGGTSFGYNLDSVIRANTAGVFDSKILGSVYINSIQVELMGADQANNLANFENVKLNISGTNNPAVTIGATNIADTYATTTNLPSSSTVNLVPYFSSGTLTFSLTGKARRATTKTLMAHVTAKVKFDK